MKNHFPTLSKRPLFSTAFLLIVSGTVAVACQVPVFRFALERWPADKYELVILHDGPLSDSDGARVIALGRSDYRSPVSANFQLQAIDVSKTKDVELKKLWEKSDSDGKPLMVTLYPRNAQEVPDRIADVVPFTDDVAEYVVDSPVRQQVVKRLVDGDSAVWIFVPSGNTEQDDAALKRLTEHVEKNEKQLELPPQDEIEADEFFSEETNIELRLSFSIVTLKRDDPKERFLLNMLLESEPDLKDLDEPMAFPVLGRGRVLYALVGKGIFEDTIAMASSFIVGPCSCQVKEQNPGFDLLLAVDWDEKVGVNALSKPLPSKTKEPVLLEIPPGKK